MCYVIADLLFYFLEFLKVNFSCIFVTISAWGQVDVPLFQKWIISFCKNAPPDMLPEDAAVLIGGTKVFVDSLWQIAFARMCTNSYDSVSVMCDFAIFKHDVDAILRHLLFLITNGQPGQQRKFPVQPFTLTTH